MDAITRIRKTIEDEGPDRLLSSGHSINPAVKVENFLATHSTVRKYGNYPVIKE